MAMIEHLDAYQDCTLIWERAIDTPGGIRLPLGERGHALVLQMRMNKCRSLHRRLSCQVNPPGSPKYNTSEFDSHMVQVRGPDERDEWWIYVRPHGRMGLLDLIEPISETEPEVLADVAAAARTRALLEHKSGDTTHGYQGPTHTTPLLDRDPDSDLE